MKAVIVSEAAVEIAPHVERLVSLGGGGIASFLGVVRGDDGVAAIELEHYPAMTQASLGALVEEASARWALRGAIVQHRVGYIACGEPIVFVGTASDHRQAALESCAFLIDRLKTDAPFWKKECLSDGDARWVAERESDLTARSKWS